MSKRCLSLETAVTQPSIISTFAIVFFYLKRVDQNHLERLEVFLFFYQYALQSFVNFNKYLQREKPLLSRLHDQIQQFLKRIACKFLQTDFVASVDMFSDVWREQENQKSGSSDL